MKTLQSYVTYARTKLKYFIIEIQMLLIK